MKSTGLRLALSAGLLAVVFPAASSAQDSGDKQTVQAKIRYCKDCHGQQGQGFQGAYPVPRLAGQPTAYLQAKAEAIMEHRRDNLTADTFVAPALASMDQKKRGEVFEHFTALNPPPAGTGPQELIPTGRRIYEEGVPQDNVPACTTCHGLEGKGSGLVPRLAGQIYPYAVKVLSLWAIINNEHAREGGSAVKSSAEHRLSQSQINAVAAYVSNLN